MSRSARPLTVACFSCLSLWRPVLSLGHGGVWRIVDNRADDEKASDVSNKFYFCLLHGTQLKARASGPVKACGHDTVESPQVSAEAMAAARPAAHAHDPSAHDLTP